ncbi:hypothetical protein VU01_12123 [Candidatus Electrothrix marina]|uniref:Uncharacterized protein n=1 Tax=Candidatus Electrothrix marina TaxID=1859130 RepID=A0A3S3QS42_9BACT|nr:hypothetical protein VT99_12411 [Candidatus Electrothrix marina]RWX50050.1 hypothetical protein VU00_11561 [Candidatus Electrothrix marina]RWX51095.1 hypothetical protein VU01_12123 [Candidatus Electrothrix marina]
MCDDQNNVQKWREQGKAPCFTTSQKKKGRIRKPRMAELNETAEAKQKLRELKEKMLTLKEHL